MKSKRLLLTLTFTVLLCLVFAVPASAESKAINIGDPVYGSFTDDIRTLEYTFEVPESGKLEIALYNGLSDKFESCLSGPGWGEFNHTVQPGSNLDAYEVAPGQYALKCRSYFYSSPGDFNFSLKFTPSGETYTAPNESINLVRKSAALPFKKKVKGHLAINDKEDWYKVDLPSSGKLTVDIHSDADLLDFGIRDAEENVTEGHLQDVGVLKGDQTETIELTKGTYYIYFNEGDSNFNGTAIHGNYSFRLTFKASGETYQYENNSVNLVRKKAAIPLATTIKGHIAENDFVDYFKVKIPKTGKYTLKIVSQVEEGEFRLLDKNEQYVEDYYLTKGTAIYTLSLKKGTYYLCAGNGHYGNYSFRITPKSVSLSKVKKAEKSFKVTWKKGTGDGYQIQYSTNKNFTKNVKKKTIKDVKTTSTTIKKLKSGKTYYVRIRSFVKGSDGKKVWSNWSQAKSVKPL